MIRSVPGPRSVRSVHLGERGDMLAVAVRLVLVRPDLIVLPADRFPRIQPLVLRAYLVPGDICGPSTPGARFPSARPEQLSVPAFVNREPERAAGLVANSRVHGGL